MCMAGGGSCLLLVMPITVILPADALGSYAVSLPWGVRHPGLLFDWIPPASPLPCLCKGTPPGLHPT